MIKKIGSSNLLFLVTLATMTLILIAYLYTLVFVSSELPDGAIMSPRTVSQLYIVFPSLLLWTVLSILSLLTIFKTKPNWKIITSLLLNSTPVLLFVIFRIF